MQKKDFSAKVSSLFQAVDIRQEIPPLIIGERANPTGSKKFRELLLNDDFAGCLQVGKEQEELGAHVLDVCAAWAGRDEKKDLEKLIHSYSQNLTTPLVIDSTTPDAIEAALALYPGKAIINSINLEDGGKTLHAVLKIAKKYGAAVIALTIDEDGMAMDCAKKMAIAHRIHRIARDEYNFPEEDLLFDPLTFTVGSGDKTLLDAALQTMDALRAINRELPACHTVLGLSNISFGLRPPARRVLNAVFLHEAIAAGLHAVIINPSNCIPLESIEQQARELAHDLLHNLQRQGEDEPLVAYINYFENNSEAGQKSEKELQGAPAEEQIRRAIMKGNQQQLGDTLPILLEDYSALEIINQLLVPTMREVGELFGAGEMLLPFVLKSAEVMKNCVDILEPHIEQVEEGSSTKILLATVQGDVHDIGKNLVNIILSNNGYEVIDIGIKASSEAIIAAAKEHQVDVIGLSGLLVKSALVMQQNMTEFAAAGLRQPILLGGAALTKKFVGKDCAPNYPGKVVYCRDAFTALNAIQEHEAGNLKSTSWSSKTEEVNSEQEEQKSISEAEVPQTPKGVFELEVEPDEYLKLIKKSTLFRGRWGYLQAKMDRGEYEALLKNEVEPILQRLLQQIKEEGLFAGKVRYGWFDCNRSQQEIVINDKAKTSFSFPRQERGGKLSLVDYFKEKSAGDDVVGFFVSTIGATIAEKLQKMYSENQYQEYFLLHGLSVAAAEALAEYTHRHMLAEIGESGRGKRYSFGYSACPDLNLQHNLFALLEAEKIGVSLSEQLQMMPEHSVSAMVVHHPDASYFAL